MDLAAIVEAVRRGGLDAVEITADTPGALDAVAAEAGRDAAVGAGTVLDARTAEAYVDAGASFLVSPGLVAEVVEVGVRRGVPVVAGALTPTEVAHAVAIGVAAVKLFPASLGGVPYLRALLGPFRDVAFVPTGGVEIDDAGTWLAAGAAAVGLGSTLVGTGVPSSDDDLEAITARAARAVAAASR